MNKKTLTSLGIIGAVLLVSVAGYYLFPSSPSPSASPTPPTVPTSSQPTKPAVSATSFAQQQSRLEEQPVLFRFHRQQVSVGDLAIATNTIGSILRVYKLIPTATSGPGVFTNMGAVQPQPSRVEFRWGDMKIVSQPRNTTLTTDKGSIVIKPIFPIFLREIWLFAFQDKHYFLLKGIDCGNKSCSGEYYLTQLDQNNNLKLIAAKEGRIRWLWAPDEGELLLGVVAVQSKLYMVFMNSKKAYTFILSRDGSLEGTVESPRGPLEKIIPDWNL